MRKEGRGDLDFFGSVILEPTSQALRDSIWYVIRGIIVLFMILVRILPLFSNGTPIYFAISSINTSTSSLCYLLLSIFPIGEPRSSHQ